jgi:hypothetical protein
MKLVKNMTINICLTSYEKESVLDFVNLVSPKSKYPSDIRSSMRKMYA